MGTGNSSSQRDRSIRETGRKPAKNLFPPPKDLPDYATRPLPPPPSSSSSSVYESDQTSQQLSQHQLFRGGAQQDTHLSTSFPGSIDESALAMVRPPSIVTNFQEPREQDEIASLRPHGPGHKALRLKTRSDSEVSPILTPPSGKNTHHQYNVSPLSPDGSLHSFNTAVSELDRSSCISNASGSEQKALDGSERRQSSQASRPPGQSSLGFQPLAVQVDQLHPRLQRINLRYSDPGSPLYGTIDPMYPGEPSHDVGRPSGPRQERSAGVHSAAQKSQMTGQSHYELWGQHPIEREAVARERKVFFAGAKVDSFSNRTTVPAQRHAPPPLKLSERPLAETYVKTENHVKTPFPPRNNSDFSEKSVFEEDDVDKKQSRRMSSLSGFAKSLRPTSSHKGEASGSAQGELHKTKEHSRASPVPTVKNILSKAKSGLKFGSDESKKEKRRVNLRRQIRVGNVEE
ncbi:hypothetical protein DL767_005505 [Monosporascus sp. MG133]|nr:hypothetical protein DL767_005505 [Monosporascus sp. MG133]